MRKGFSFVDVIFIVLLLVLVAVLFVFVLTTCSRNFEKEKEDPERTQVKNGKQQDEVEKQGKIDSGGLESGNETPDGEGQAGKDSDQTGPRRKLPAEEPSTRGEMGRGDPEAAPFSEGGGGGKGFLSSLLGGGAHPPDSPKESLSSQPAIQEARSLRQKSERLAREGQYGQAYQKVLEAWERIRPFASQDSEAASLLRELEHLLQEYGEEANARAAPLPEYQLNGKPFAVK